MIRRGLAVGVQSRSVAAVPGFRLAVEETEVKLPLQRSPRGGVWVRLAMNGGASNGGNGVLPCNHIECHNNTKSGEVKVRVASDMLRVEAGAVS